MNFWHIQMSQGLLDGIDKTEEEVIEILQEEGLIGTGEWKDNNSDQCRAFKKTMAKGDIVMVRAGQKPLALVQVVSDSAPDYIYESHSAFPGANFVAYFHQGSGFSLL